MNAGTDNYGAMDRTAVDRRYLDSSLGAAERASILVGQMTLREKIAQMSHRAPPLPRLDVPAYNWWNECLHGVARAGRATVFPQAIGLAATFDVELMTRVAVVISDEARAKHHQALRQGHRGIYLGLTFWSPNINIFRDPRWGRGQETYGECPYLTARMGVAFVRGLQGDHPKYLKLVATPKHFAVHSGPEPLRHGFNAEVGGRDLRETYLAAFKACVQEGGAWSVMPAYNRTNGEPCCGSPTLLQKVLRGEWGFQGYVVSDCWAIKDFHESHQVTSTPEESAAMAVRSGCDLNCGDIYPRLLDAVGQGLVGEEEITRSVERLFTARFKLGMFDAPEDVPWSQLPPDVVNCAEHRELARQAARESIVLLKNDGLLPLRKDLESILVVGPNACAIDVLLGNYHGLSPQLTTMVEGLAGAVAAGSKVTWCAGRDPVDLAWHLAEADVVIACMGFTPEMEGEEMGGLAVAEGGGDRLSIGLPGRQLDVLKALHATGKPVALVLTGGGPVDLNWAHEHIPAIVMAWYPGEAGGHALADVLFGDYNPSGRLPVTFIKSLDDIPAFTDYRMRGRTYRFMDKDVLYPFGHGLSYTRFAYANLTVEGLRVSVDVTNTGARDGDEVVQIYLSQRNAPVPVPVRQLAGFQRVHLARGETMSVTFELKREQLWIYDDDGVALDHDDFLVHAGGGQHDGPDLPVAFQLQT